MADLYYLLSSIPTLMFDRPVAYSYDKLITDASTILSGEAVERLKSFSLLNPPTSLDGLGALECEYWDWDASLRNDLVRLRAEALGLRADDHLRQIGSNGIATEQAKVAFNEDNPLKVEDSLDRSRWNFLESRKAGKIFDFDILLIYSMQLQILSRRAKFVQEIGRTKYEQEYKKILGDAETVLAENI